MSAENPEKREATEPSFEKEMASLEVSLRSLIDGKKVDYEKQMGSVQNQLEAMEMKYEADKKIIKFLRQIERKVSGIAIAIGGALALLLTEKTPAVVLATGGFSLAILVSYGESKVTERAIKIQEDIKELISTSREFTSAYLQKGGAVVDESGRLEVTKEQVEKAREEMNKEL